MVRLGKFFAVVLVMLLGLFLAAPGATAASLKMAPTAVSTTPQVSQPKLASFSPCDLAINPLIRSICEDPAAAKKAAEDAAAAAAKRVAEAATGVASTVASSILEVWTAPAREASNFVFPIVASAITSVKDPDVQAVGFFDSYQRILGLAFALLALVIPIGLLMNLKSPKRLLGVGINGLKALLLGIIAPGLVQILIIIVGNINTVVTTNLGENGATFASQLSGLIALQTGPVLGMFVSAYTIAFFGAVLFIELNLRNVGIYMAVLLAPLAFLALVMGEWGKTLFNKLVTFLFALIIGLPLSSAILVVGTSIAASSEGQSAASQLVKMGISIAVVGFAALVPFALMFVTPHVVATIKDSWNRSDEQSEGSPQSESSSGRGLVRQLVSGIPEGKSAIIPAIATAIAGPEAGVAAHSIQNRLFPPKEDIRTQQGQIMAGPVAQNDSRSSAPILYRDPVQRDWRTAQGETISPTMDDVLNAWSPSSTSTSPNRGGVNV